MTSRPILALCWFLVGSLGGARGHDFLSAYVQHRAEIVVGAKDIDVSLRLTFFEEGSEHERKRMDTNADGIVSRKEAVTYLKELEPKLEQKLKLVLNGKHVQLITLYPPELNLLGNDRVHRERHILTLHFFARTPADLAPGSEFVLTDELWPDFRAIGLIQATSKDGCQLEAVPPGGRVDPDAKHSLSFVARLAKPFTPAERQLQKLNTAPHSHE